MGKFLKMGVEESDRKIEIGIESFLLEFAAFATDIHLPVKLKFRHYRNGRGRLEMVHSGTYFIPIHIVRYR